MVVEAKPRPASDDAEIGSWHRGPVGRLCHDLCVEDRDTSMTRCDDTLPRVIPPLEGCADGVRGVQWTTAAATARMAPTPGSDPTVLRADDRASRRREPSSWWRHRPYLRTLSVAIVLTVAAASAGMLMAFMGD